MKYLHLIWAALFRSKTRTLLTLLSVVAAFLLFGMLDSVRVAFNSSANVEGYDRLITTSKLSITQALPYSLLTQIESTPGRQCFLRDWFGGIYQDPNNFANYAVGLVHGAVSRIRAAADQLQAFNSERTGAVVGESLASSSAGRSGRHPASGHYLANQGQQRLAFQARRHLQACGQEARGRRAANDVPLEVLRRGKRLHQGPGSLVRARPGRRQQGDASCQGDRCHVREFRDQAQTEQAFNQAFFKQIGDIGLIVTAVMSAVFTTAPAGRQHHGAGRARAHPGAGAEDHWLQQRQCALAGADGVDRSHRDRPGDRPRHCDAADPAVSAASGGAIQLGTVPPATWLLGLALMVGLGIVVGAQPALRAMRLNIVDALADR